jgi:hypothetical protein
MAARVAATTTTTTTWATTEENAATATATAAATGAATQRARTATTPPTEIVTTCAANGTRDTRLAGGSVGANCRSRTADAARTADRTAVVAAFGAVEAAEGPAGAAHAADGGSAAACATESVGRAQEVGCAYGAGHAIRSVDTCFAGLAVGARTGLDAEAIEGHVLGLKEDRDRAGGPERRDLAGIARPGRRVVATV